MGSSGSGLSADCVSCPVRTRHVEGPVSDETFASLARALARRSYRDRQTLFVQGHPATQLFFIRSGALRLSRVQPDGREMLLDIVGPGGAVGVEALFGGEHAATATASGDLQCCTAPGEVLRSLVATQPQVTLALLRMVREELEAMRTRLAEIAGAPAEQRVARFLLETLPAWQEQAPSLTQVEIACALGLAPETLCRVLSDFRRRRWLAGQGLTLRVIAEQQLARVAGR